MTLHRNLRKVVEEIDLSEHNAWPSWDPNLVKNSNHSDKTGNTAPTIQEEYCDEEKVYQGDGANRKKFEETTLVSAQDEHEDDEAWKPTPLQRQRSKVLYGRKTRASPQCENVRKEPKSNTKRNEEYINKAKSFYEEGTILSAPVEHESDYDWKPSPLKRERPKVLCDQNMRSPSVCNDTKLIHERETTSPERQDSGVYITIHRRMGDDDDDDDLTQITLDQCFDTSFYKKENELLNEIPEDDYTINNDCQSNKTKYLGSSTKSDDNCETKIKKPIWVHSINASCLSNADVSQQRIREIIWKDLSSKECAVVQKAMEDLHTVLIKGQNKSRSYVLIKSGLMSILGAMEGYPASKAIQFLSCSILEQLASLDRHINKAIIEMGGISMIEKSMKVHADCKAVNEMCTITLTTLLSGL